MGVDNISEELFSTLMPYASNKVKQARANPTLGFVHYTSADALLKILQSGEVWFRNSSMMNDFSEVEYGLQRLRLAWGSDAGVELRRMLEESHPGVIRRLTDYHNGWQPQYTKQTYLFSVSEHLESENNLGRLSMWREYARNSGVALVLRTDAFNSETQLLKAYTVPVMYADQSDFLRNFEKIRDSLRDNAVEFSRLSPEKLFSSLFQVFRFITLSTKHPGFAEELEWRVVYNPTMESSPYFTERIVSLGGVPQKIFALGLEEIGDAEEELDLSLNALVDRVIIGPTEYQETIGEAVVRAMGDAGVSDAESKVTYSNIPVRTD
jgi:hypothetical protein